jgi:hypothetical protein
MLHPRRLPQEEAAARAAAVEAAVVEAAAVAIARAAAAVRAADEEAAAAGTTDQWDWDVSPSVTFAPFPDASSSDDDEVLGKQTMEEEPFVFMDNPAFAPSMPPTETVQQEELEASLAGSPSPASSSDDDEVLGTQTMEEEPFVFMDNPAFAPSTDSAQQEAQEFSTIENVMFVPSSPPRSSRVEVLEEVEEDMDELVSPYSDGIVFGFDRAEAEPEHELQAGWTAAAAAAESSTCAPLWHRTC